MENLRVIIVCFKDGICDSIVLAINVITSVVKQWRHPQYTNFHNLQNLLKRIRQCCFLSGLLMLSLLMFNYILLELLYLTVTFIFGSQDSAGSTWSYLEPTLSILFKTLWVVPLILLSRAITVLWFQDIADNSFKGRQQPFRSISQLIADTLFGIFIQFLFLIQANLSYLLCPIESIGQIISILQYSLLYSLYSFEYKWFSMGWELHRRLYYIERMWPYFSGFGLPLALATHMMPNYFSQTALFSLLFPLFILTANEAGETRTTNKINYKIPFFSFVVWLSNKLLFLALSLSQWIKKRNLKVHHQ